MGFTKSSMGHPGPMATDLEDRISAGGGGRNEKRRFKWFLAFPPLFGQEFFSGKARNATRRNWEELLRLIIVIANF